MPVPKDRRGGRLDPNQLARLVANHLAQTGIEPAVSRWSVRTHLSMGRLMAGLSVLAFVTGLVLVLTGAVGWSVDPVSGPSAEVTSAGDEIVVDTSEEPTTSPVEDVLSLFLPVRLLSPTSLGSPLPPAVSSTTSSSVVVMSPTTSTTTRSVSTSTSPPIATVTSATTTTMFGTTTTSNPPTTTTTVVSTTTTEGSTTTTCTNPGNGSGNGPCK